MAVLKLKSTEHTNIFIFVNIQLFLVLSTGTMSEVLLDDLLVDQEEILAVLVWIIQVKMEMREKNTKCKFQMHLCMNCIK